MPTVSNFAKSCHNLPNLCDFGATLSNFVNYWQGLSIFGERCRSLPNRAESCLKGFNLAKYRQFLANPVESCRIWRSCVEFGQTLPNIARPWPILPDIVGFSHIMSDMAKSRLNSCDSGQILLNLAKSSQVLPDLVKSCRHLRNMAESCQIPQTSSNLGRSGRIVANPAISCRMPQNIATSCQISPYLARSRHRMPYLFKTGQIWLTVPYRAKSRDILQNRAKYSKSRHIASTNHAESCQVLPAASNFAKSRQI